MKAIIANKFRNLIRSVLISNNQDIKNELARRALKSTVDYVEKNMKNINSVNTKYKVHDIAINQIEVKNGLCMEFGVYKADTINYIAKKIESEIYGFDSFEGLPEFWRDGFDKGAFSTEGLPQVRKNIRLIKGWFHETLPVFLKDEIRPISYLHIDCDLYSSTKTIFDLLDKQIVEGTVIVFDEYFNFIGWQNDEFRAFQEFIFRTKKEYKYITYNHLHEQVAIKIIKD